MQDRQIKATAVPGNEVWCVPIDAIVEASHELCFVGVFVTQAPDTKAVAGTQRHRYRNDSMLMQWQEITSGFLQLLETHRRGDIFVGYAFQIPHATSEFDVGDGLYIK
jgi:hypothetical protein